MMNWLKKLGLTLVALFAIQMIIAIVVFFTIMAHIIIPIICWVVVIAAIVGLIVYSIWKE